jgi:hypothetical protein
VHVAQPLARRWRLSRKRAGEGKQSRAGEKIRKEAIFSQGVESKHSRAESENRAFLNTLLKASFVTGAKHNSIIIEERSNALAEMRAVDPGQQ